MGPEWQLSRCLVLCAVQFALDCPTNRDRHELESNGRSIRPVNWRRPNSTATKPGRRGRFWIFINSSVESLVGHCRSWWQTTTCAAVPVPNRRCVPSPIVVDAGVVVVTANQQKDCSLRSSEHANSRGTGATSDRFCASSDLAQLKLVETGGRETTTSSPRSRLELINSFAAICSSFRLSRQNFRRDDGGAISSRVSFRRRRVAQTQAPDANAQSWAQLLNFASSSNRTIHRSDERSRGPVHCCITLPLGRLVCRSGRAVAARTTNQMDKSRISSL